MTPAPKALPQQRVKNSALSLAVLASTLMGVFFFILWDLLNDANRQRIDEITSHANQVAEELIRQDFESRFSAIERLAHRWIAAGDTPGFLWEADALEYLEDMPGLQTIVWLDADKNLRWMAPLEGTEALRAQGFENDERVKAVFASAQQRGISGVAQPYEILEGEFGVSIYVPVIRDGEFDGLVSGVMGLQPWLEAVFSSTHRAGYLTQVFIDDQQVYGRSNDSHSVDNMVSSHRKFELQGLQWATILAPAGDSMAAIYLRISTFLLTIGLLFSGLFGLAVYQALNAKKRSRELRASTSQLSTLMQNLQGMVYRTYELEYPWPMQFVSAGCKNLCGYEQSELEESQVLWGEIIHPDDRENVVSTVRNAVENNQAFELEYRIRTRNEVEKWVWERGRCVESPNTKRRNLEGFISDITQRKLAEIRFSQAQAFSQSIVDTAAEAVITIDTSGIIDSFNHAAERMFDYSVDEVLGKNVDMLMPQPYRDEHNDYLRRYIDTGEARIIGTGRIVSAQRKDGSVFPIQLSVSEIDGQNQRMFVGLIRDISLEKASEEEARLRRDQLAHVDRLHLLGEMATGIAHEINQPLTSISLFSQAGKRFLDSGNVDRLPDIFDKLSKHALRAGAIIEQMQSMTRQRESEKTIVDCNTLIHEITQLAEADARIHDVQLKVESSSQLPTVAVDVVQIQQVTLNLLRNGMEAMQSVDRRFGSSITVKTSLRDNGDVEVSVADSGGGVSEEVAKKLFSPFSTTKEYGMGMGLSICRAIIIAHGGQLSFVNNEIGGATFFFNLPAARQGADHE